MIIQTIQPLCVLKELQSTGIVRARSQLDEVFKEIHGPDGWGFESAYQWMKEQMTLKGITPTIDDKDLFWGWAWSGDRNQKKIDLRTRKGQVNSGDVILTLEKNEDDILLSSFDLWHHVLNYWPISRSPDEENFWDIFSQKPVHNFYEQKPLKTEHHQIAKTWQSIFKIKSVKDYFHFDLSNYQYAGINTDEKITVQATFWNIKINELKSFKIIK